MKLRSLLSLVLGIALLGSSAVGEGRFPRATTFSGTWTCVTCKSDQPSKFRDYYFHDYGLVLDNGEYIMFWEAKQAEGLIKGNEKVQTRIDVTGLYDDSSRTLRVLSYVFEGIEYTWCELHQQMDACDQQKFALESASRP